MSLSLLLPIIISSLTYLYAALLLNTNNTATHNQCFEAIQNIFSSCEYWATAFLQSYYVYVFPFLIAIAFLVQSSENVNSGVQKYNDISFGKCYIFVNELALFISAAFIMLIVNLVTAYGCYVFYAHLIRANRFIYNINALADYSFFAIFKPFGEIAVGILLICLVYYLLIDLLIILTKSLYVSTFLIVFMHVVQLTPYVFVSAYHSFLSNTLYGHIRSLFFYFPSRYIAKDLVNMSPESSLVVISISLFVLFGVSLFVRKHSLKG